MPNQMTSQKFAAATNNNFQTNRINNLGGDISERGNVVPIFDDVTFQEAKERVENNAVEAELFFTKDKNLLKEYYDLRAEAYRAEWGFDNFDNSETIFDKQGDIIVAVKNGVVVGGMRLMFSDSCDYLSNEVPGTQYEYIKYIRKYDNREKLIIGEISALVVRKNYRDNKVSLAMFDAIFKKAKEHGCHYVFGVTVPLVCRSDRRTLRQIGYDLEIVINYPWEKKRLYNFVTMFPVYVKL